MSKLARTLILAATVAALNLAGLTAVAHARANDQDTPSQQELAERWNADYYQATHMSPAQHKAWLQARDRAGTPTEKTVQVPAPVRPDQPSGQPLWLVVALGALAAALAIVAGLALLAARRANRSAQVGPAT
jgi:hypothetical protein